MKSYHLGKCFHLTFLYIIGHNCISWKPPHDDLPPLPISRSGVGDIATHRIDAYAVEPVFSYRKFKSALKRLCGADAVDLILQSNSYCVRKNSPRSLHSSSLIRDS